jgi:hypothetical protein
MARPATWPCWICLILDHYTDFWQASELINFGADAVNNGTTIFDILQFVFPAAAGTIWDLSVKRDLLDPRSRKSPW